MSLQAVVKEAENPKVALEAIARYLDHLNTKIDAVLEQATPTDSGWGEWSDPDENLEDQVADLKEQLANETDPQEIQAIAAKLKLLTDDGSNQPEATLPKGKRVEIVPGENGGYDVVIPSPNEDQLEKRELFYDEVLDPHYNWSPEEGEAFLRGGPLLLYYNDREMVRTLPPLWIRQFIEDVEVNSPEEANEMARDLLKDVEPDSMQDLTIENLRRDLENM